MESGHANLLQNTEAFLQGNQTDSEKFQGLWSEIHDGGYNEEGSLIQKVGPLSQSQLYLLRSQMLAYKHLIRNIPVPTHFNWSGVHAGTWQTQKEKLTARAVTFYRDKIEKEQELKNMIMENIKLPSKDESIDYAEQVKFYVEKRKGEIDHILDKLENLSPQTRQRLIIESKFLGVKDIYQKVMTQIIGGVKKDTKTMHMFEKQLLDRNYFRRQKLQRNRDTGNRVQKLQNQMKSDHQRRKKIKHRQFMQHLRIHKQEFMEWHRKRQKDRKKLVNQAKSIYDKKQSRDETDCDGEKAARIEALSKYNITEYIRLLKGIKKNKIKELLDQTNKFLKQLGAKVLVQKGSNQDDPDQPQFKQGAQTNQDNMEMTFNIQNNVYYNLTHTVKEEIREQPTILRSGTLKNYQLIGLQWLVSLYNNNLNGILADEMGLGKTIQTISLLCYLIEFKKNYGPFLIVVPLSTISNWVAQFEKWAPSIRKVIYRGNPTTRNQVLKIMKTTKWNVCITTYDFILKDRLRLNKYDWKYIIIDEGHKMKNAKSKFAGVLGQQYQSNHRLLLTGTPLQNNLGELWALLNFLLPKVFNSCQDFEKWFSMAISKNKFGQAIKLDKEEQLLIINRLHQVLRPFLLRRVKKEVESQLPDKKEHVVKIQLSAWQKLIYDNISSKSALEFANKSGKISTTTLTNLMMQLRKCCNHPYLFLKNYDDICYHDWIWRSSGKFELLDRILPKLKEFDHKVLIFTQMTHLMDIMQIYFEYKNVKHLRLDGSTKSDDREQRTTLFNQENSDYDVFLLSTRAGGLGLNLQKADTVILFDSDWNPQMDLQAQDRAHRIGQKKEVVVLRFVTNSPIQELILKKAAFKMDMDELLIQGGMYNLNSSEAERKKKIQDVLKRTKQGDDNEDEITDDSMINQYIARNSDEEQRYTRMDEERIGKESLIYQNWIDSKQSQEERKNFNYRIMGHDQIPSWFIEAPKETEIKEYGRGNRARKQVNYNDDVIDQQLFQLHIDEEEDIFAADNDFYVQVPDKKGTKKKNQDSKSNMSEQNQYLN